MDNEQAKLILSAYRANGEDATDAIFEEALELARRDPELGRWFQTQRQLDAVFQAAIQSEVPPPELRDQLLVQPKVAESHFENRPLVPRSGKRIGWLAAAAALIVAFSFLVFSIRRSPPALAVADVAQVLMEKNLSDTIRLENRGDPLPKLRQWLESRAAPAGFEIPQNIADRPPLGCQVYDVRGVELALVCFELEDGRVLHVFFVETDKFSNPPGSTPELLTVRRNALATWSDRGITYFVLGLKIGPDDLQRLVDPHVDAMLLFPVFHSRA